MLFSEQRLFSAVSRDTILASNIYSRNARVGFRQIESRSLPLSSNFFRNRTRWGIIITDAGKKEFQSLR
jgi:hypothetical protein